MILKQLLKQLFNYLDLYTQFELFDYLLNLAIKACLINQNKNNYYKSKKKNNSVLFKITLPYIVIKKDLLYHDLNKILSHITYELNIKEIDSNYISLLIIFNIWDLSQTNPFYKGLIILVQINHEHSYKA